MASSAPSTISLATPELQVKNPKFAALLESLHSTHITPSGVSKSVQLELDKANALLESERSTFLYLNLIVTEIENLLLEDECDTSVTKSMNRNSSMAQELQQIRGRFVRLRAKTQLEAYNSQSSGNSASERLLGLLPEDLGVPKTALQTNSIVGEIVRRLSARLKHLEEFADFSEPKGATLLTSHKTFVDEVSQKSHTYSSQKLALNTSTQAVDALYLSYYNLLGKTLYLLVHLVNDNKMKDQAQQDQLNVKLLQHRAQAMILKLVVLQHQITAETYTTDSVPALNAIKAQLESRTQSVESKLDRASKQLTQYENLGQGFTQLVRQYVTIMDATKDKQWTLSQLSDKS
jgi:hypothetical protein